MVSTTKSVQGLLCQVFALLQSLILLLTVPRIRSPIFNHSHHCCRSLSSYTRSLAGLRALKSLYKTLHASGLAVKLIGITSLDQFLALSSSPSLSHLPPLSAPLPRLVLFTCHALFSLSLSFQLSNLSLCVTFVLLVCRMACSLLPSSFFIDPSL